MSEPTQHEVERRERITAIVTAIEDPAYERGYAEGLAAGRAVSPDPDLREALATAWRDGLIGLPDDGNSDHRWCGGEDSGGNHTFDSSAWLDDLSAALSRTEASDE